MHILLATADLLYYKIKQQSLTVGMLYVADQALFGYSYPVLYAFTHIHPIFPCYPMGMDKLKRASYGEGIDWIINSWVWVGEGAGISKAWPTAT